MVGGVRSGQVFCFVRDTFYKPMAALLSAVRRQFRRNIARSQHALLKKTEHDDDAVATREVKLNGKGWTVLTPDLPLEFPQVDPARLGLYVILNIALCFFNYHLQKRTNSSTGLDKRL